MLRTQFGQRADVTFQIRESIESGKAERASGGVKCNVCGWEYWKHCNLAEPYSFLTLICDGTIVKL